MGAAQRLRAREHRARFTRLLNEWQLQDDELSMLRSEVAADEQAWAHAQRAVTSGALQRLAAWFDQRVDFAVPAPTSHPPRRTRPSAVRRHP